MDTNSSSCSPLHSELVNFCLPAARREPTSKLAWTNSICVMFLIIGLTGAKNASDAVRPPAPVEEPVPAVLEPTPPPPPSSQEQAKEEPTEQDKSAAPQVIVVTPDSPAINFSVPTIGNLVVPNAVASAPPLKTLPAPAPVRSAPAVLNNTGEGGDRPRPPYPQMALLSAQQGTVIVTMVANEAGLFTSVMVKETSGYPILDHGTADFIKKHWLVPPGAAGRIFEAKIIYQLKLKL